MGGNGHARRAAGGCARRWLLLGLAFAAAAAKAQSGSSAEPPAPAPAPAPAPSPAPSPAPAPAPAAPGADAASKAAQLEPVQITGSRPDDVQERRQSTAAKIIIGREEIERFGDSTLGDVLKRLPGVTVQGPPGRGGAIRFRGLGGGYTQILLDGQRVPPGFSLDSLTPDQIERIEILRAPTAETGARAIAGTINIVTRDGYSKRVNDLRLNAGYENGRFRPSASWSRNIAEGAWTVNYSLSAYHWGRDGSNTTTTVDERLSDQAVTLRQRDVGKVWTVGDGINGNGRLQWRSEGGVDTVTLMPIAYYNRGRWHRDGTLEQPVGGVPPPYDTAHSEGEYSSSLLRLNGQWNHRFDSTARLEWKLGAGLSRQPSDSDRAEYTSGGLTRTQLDSGSSRETSATSSLKFTHTVLDDHSLVGGLEVEALRERDDRTTLQNGLPILTDFGDDVRASSVRLAAYAQDEWNLTPNWAAHAGLRVEQITTRGTVAEGEPDAKNRSSVWTPLLHAVWKPDPKGRDQVRMSLTRSYRSPPLGNLLGRPSVNSRYPVPGPNTPTTPDRAGNPDLKPELATGIDIAVERYLPGSGLISANVFRRNIRDYMRSVTTLETVPYATSQRYVLRPQNVGRAMTEGAELELKFRASDLWPEAPRLDVRTNASFFRSKVKSVPGPDDRLDSQPGYTANLGLDYRFRAIPLTLGGNLNWTPGYLTRISEAQKATISRKLVADAYALYTFSPSTALRFTLSNLAAQDYVTGSAVDGPDFTGVPVRETASTRTPTYLNAQVRLELKL